MSCKMEDGVFTYTVVIEAGDRFEIPIQQYPLLRINGFIGDTAATVFQILDPRLQVSVAIPLAFTNGSALNTGSPFFDLSEFGQPSLQNKGTCVVIDNAFGVAPLVVSYSQKRA